MENIKDTYDFKSGFYKHNETGKKCVAQNISIDCTNKRAGTVVVVYREFGEKNQYVREINEFNDKFTLLEEI